MAPAPPSPPPRASRAHADDRRPARRSLEAVTSTFTPANPAARQMPLRHARRRRCDSPGRVSRRAARFAALLARGAGRSIHFVEGSSRGGEEG